VTAFSAPDAAYATRDMGQDQFGGDSRPSVDVQMPAPPPYASVPVAPTTSPALLAMAIATVLLVAGGSGIALWRHAGITNASPAAAVLPSPTAVPTPVPTPSATPALHPLPAGQAIAGGHAGAIPWTPLDDGGMSVRVVPGGVDMRVSRVGLADTRVTAPVPEWIWANRVDAHVTVVDGALGNNVGVGCATPDGDHWLSFTIDDGQNWRIVLSRTGQDHVVDSGTSDAIAPLRSGNDLSAVCVTTTDLRLHLMLAVNNAVVGDTTISAPESIGWTPTVVACTCFGPEEVRVTNMVQSTIPRG